MNFNLKSSILWSICLILKPQFEMVAQILKEWGLSGVCGHVAKDWVWPTQNHKLTSNMSCLFEFFCNFYFVIITQFSNVNFVDTMLCHNTKRINKSKCPQNAKCRQVHYLSKVTSVVLFLVAFFLGKYCRATPQRSDAPSCWPSGSGVGRVEPWGLLS